MVLGAERTGGVQELARLSDFRAWGLGLRVWVPTSFECKYEPKLCPRLGLVTGGLELEAVGAPDCVFGSAAGVGLGWGG